MIRPMISLLTLVPAAVFLLGGLAIARVGGRFERRHSAATDPAEVIEDAELDGSGPERTEPGLRRRSAAIGPVLIALGAFSMLVGLVLVGLWVLLEPVLGVRG